MSVVLGTGEPSGGRRTPATPHRARLGATSFPERALASGRRSPVDTAEDSDDAMRAVWRARGGRRADHPRRARTSWSARRSPSWGPDDAIRALLAVGRATMFAGRTPAADFRAPCAPGERRWVREAWRVTRGADGELRAECHADRAAVPIRGRVTPAQYAHYEARVDEFAADAAADRARCRHGGRRARGPVARAGGVRAVGGACGGALRAGERLGSGTRARRVG